MDAFCNLGLDCNGVDLSDHAVKNQSHLKVISLDISKNTFPYAEGTFDVVYYKSLLEHFYDPGNLITETYRVLKPGGRVIILTPDWVSQMRTFYEDFTHCRPYDVTSVKDLLQIYNFYESHAELFYQLPLLWDFPIVKIFSRLTRSMVSTPVARRLTEITGLKFFRWSVELMVLGTGIKHTAEK